jgi:hypothetical protein
MEYCYFCAWDVRGTALGLIFGYWTSSHLETKRQKHEKEMEYRKELTKHMEDIIKPLFHLIEELWGNLAVLGRSISIKSSNIEDLLVKTRKAEQNLKQFYDFYYS